MPRREFTVAGEHHYNRSGPVRWIVSHVVRYPGAAAMWVVGTTISVLVSSVIPLVVGQAFGVVLVPHPNGGALLTEALLAAALVVAQFVSGTAGIFGSEFLAQRLERDSRDELYLSLLGKSQTFHNRQQVGDIMARANNDVRQLNAMMNPGFNLILSDTTLSLIIPIIFIATLDRRLLLAPLLFAVALVWSLRRYVRRLAPVSSSMRREFGTMNATLAETVTGIEVVKSAVQEPQEMRRFLDRARAYRNDFVRNGRIQAMYLPRLLERFAFVIALVQGILMVGAGQLSVPSLVAYLGLFALLEIPTFNSDFTFNLVQLGIAGAGRILTIMREETELDENVAGHAGTMTGDIVFDHVSFHFGDTPILRDVSFRAAPGETIAIVGQTGSGKTTLTKLVNRTYDVSAGRVLVDGVDVRDWQLDALRSQISNIEQDIFLFSRSIVENISFGQGAGADHLAIQGAARGAQAHEFIMGFKDGYDTVIGERGVTLSGGQRQRIAIARALLTDPRILILDDSTSAIDSATEDEIQKAIHEVRQGRTTLLITHRLSQIRWADKVLVLRQGEVVDIGTHDQLMRRCALYRRIFARYDTVPVASGPAAEGAGDADRGERGGQQG